MELKKNPKADLKRFRGLLLEIGLIVALILVIAAAMYTPKEHRIEQVVADYVVVEEQIVEITRQEPKVPPPPQKKVEVNVVTDFLKVVTNDTVVEMKVDFTEFDEDIVIVSDIGTTDEVIDDGMPLLYAEVMPTFMGGDLSKFRTWVMQRLIYPAVALENGISGRVFLSFIIEKDGTLSTIEVLVSPDRSLSDAAISVLKESPKWTPAMQRNQPVRLKFSLPVDFVLQ